MKTNHDRMGSHILRVVVVLLLMQFAPSQIFADVSQPVGQTDFVTYTPTITKPCVYDEVMVIYGQNIRAINESELASPSSTKPINGKILKKYFAGDNKTLLRIKLSAGKDVQSVMAENWSLKDSRILRVEPNYRVYANVLSNDPYLSYQWALHNTGQTQGTTDADIDAAESWPLTIGSSSVIVAVIDSGVDYTHPDLVNQIWTNSDEIPDNGIDDDRNGYIDDVRGWDFVTDEIYPMDENGHGTHCSGIIAAQGNNAIGITGVNWQCKIMPCRFLDANGSGTIADAVEAINYAVANGARILNNSWGGGGYSETLKAAIENANANGVIFVAAAGNSSTNTDVSAQYPSCYAVSNIISVAATDHRDNLASFSCYGSQTVDLAAPGVSILSTLPGGYGWCSGTSMAAPYVSGAAALLLSLYPDQTVTELKDRLLWSGDQIPDLQGKTRTGRRLNVYQAITQSGSLSLNKPIGNDRWAMGFSYPIEWSSVAAASTVSIYLDKAGQTVTAIAESVANTGSYSWRVPDTLDEGSDYTIRITDGSLSGSSPAITISANTWDYYTEVFTEQHPADLSNKSILFVPRGQDTYSARTTSLSALPVNPTGGISIVLRDDDAAQVFLDKPVTYFGTSYTKVYVGSNGYLTFGLPDAEYIANASTQFQFKRIAGYFHDMNPALGGSISMKKLADRIAFTWNNVPDYDGPSSGTFQIELFYNGRIRLSWLEMTPVNAVVGLSDGLGLPEDFENSDISTYATYSPALQAISIGGAKTVIENQTVQLSCTGYYDDGSVKDITHDGTVIWTTDSPAAVVDTSGLLTAGQVTLFQHATVTAQVQNISNTSGIWIQDNSDSLLTVTSCSVAAGKKTGKDTFSMTAVTQISSSIFDQTKSVQIGIYSNKNSAIWTSSFATNKKNFKKGILSQTQKIAGRSETIRLNTNTMTLSLALTNTNLQGLNSPFYVVVTSGQYAAVTQVNSVSTPLSLLNGSQNTLQITQVLVSTQNTPDRDVILIQGSFSLQNKTSGNSGVTVKWNDQTYNCGTSCGVNKKNVYTYSNISGPGGILTAQLNFVNNTFTIQIRNATVAADLKKVFFQLSFGSFSESSNLSL